MAITYKNKDRNAPEGTPESLVSDDDMNEIKSEVNLARLDRAASIYVADGDELLTTISVGDGDAGNPTKILGTYTEKEAKDFTTAVDGTVTAVTGGRTSIIANLNALTSTGTNIDYNFYIAINGIVSVFSRQKVTISSGDLKSITFINNELLSAGDTVNIFIENLDNTNNITCSAIKIMLF